MPTIFAKLLWPARTGFALAAVLLMSTSVAAQPPVEFPDTRSGKIAAAFFAAFNTGDETTMASFMTNNGSAAALAEMSAQDRARRGVRLFGATGKLTPHTLESASDQQLVLLVQVEKGPGWGRLTLFFDPQDGGLAAIQVLPTESPDDPLNQIASWSSLDDLCEQVVAASKLPGLAVAVMSDGRVSEVGVGGERALGTGDKIQSGDGFHFGSLTKSMTAVVIARLIEQKRFDWNTEITRIMPDFSIDDSYGGVTVEHLLQHRSGLDSYLYFTQVEANRADGLADTAPQRRKLFAAEILAKPAKVSVGTYLYSNGGYTVLGHIAERVTGRNWDELVQEYVFDSCGMKTAGVGWPASPDHTDAAHGHYAFGEQTVTMPLPATGERFIDVIAPAGDTHGSVHDAARYAIAHMEGVQGKASLGLKAKTMARLHTPMVSESSDVYAGGWIIAASEHGPVHWHNGSLGSYYAKVSLYPKSNRAVVILTNTGHSSAASVVDRVEKMINAASRDDG